MTAQPTGPLAHHVLLAPGLLLVVGRLALGAYLGDFSLVDRDRVGIALDVPPPRTGERIRTREQALGQQRKDEPPHAALPITQRRESRVARPAVLAQRLDESQLLRRPLEGDPLHTAVGERRDLAATLSALVELGLQPADHDEVHLAALCIVELARLTEPDGIELLEQPGEARCEAIVWRRREKQAMLGVLGNLGEHLGAVGPLTEAERREVVCLVNDEQVPRERMTTLQPLGGSEEGSREHRAGAGSPST